MSEHPLTTVTFTSLVLPPELLRGVEDAGFEFCTPIQAAALPRALDGHDVEGQAQTGTGKSAAFLLAAMNHLLRRRLLPSWVWQLSIIHSTQMGK